MLRMEQEYIVPCASLMLSVGCPNCHTVFTMKSHTADWTIEKCPFCAVDFDKDVLRAANGLMHSVKSLAEVFGEKKIECAFRFHVAPGLPAQS